MANIELNVTNLVGGNIVITTSSSGGGDTPVVTTPTTIRYDNGETRTYNIVGEINSKNYVNTIFVEEDDEHYSAEEIILGSQVTGIGDRTFYNETQIQVTISDSVTSIGEQAFWGSEIESLTIPNTVTSIGYDAFCDCQYLNHITFQNRTFDDVSNMNNFPWGCDNLDGFEFYCSDGHFYWDGSDADV